VKKVAKYPGSQVTPGNPATWQPLLAALLVLATFSATPLSACPVCFGGPDSITKGMDTAIFFLLSIVGLVQLGFVALFWSFRRRAKELQRRREQFHLIEGGLR
jgi:hypothetical protein